MSKELEYIQNHIKIVRQQVNHSQVRFLITDPVKKASYDFYENELQTLESIEKSLKALEIIKAKKVNILLLELAENVDEYNERIVPNGQLTQEEFNLLKEVEE